METYTDKRKMTIEEAWHRFQGEKMIVRFALQMFALGFTGDSFKAEFSDDKKVLDKNGKYERSDVPTDPQVCESDL